MNGGKKFQTPEIVLLMTLAIGNDALDIFSDFSLAIPVVGEAIAGGTEMVNIFLFAGISFWFIMKLGFGAPVIIQGSGGLAEMVGLPARTVTVAIAIYLANHPKAAQVVALTSVAAGTSELGTAAKEAEQGAKVATVAEEATIGAEGAGAGAIAEAKSVGVAEGAEEAEKMERGEEAFPTEKTAPETKKISPEALGEEKNVFEKMQEELEKIPQAERKESKGDDVEVDDENNLVNLNL